MNPIPGWYDDGQRNYRWWDGSAWTRHVGTPPAPPSTNVSGTKLPLNALWAGGLLLALIFVFPAVMVFVSTPRTVEARMEANLHQWAESVNTQDFESFKELSHPQLWEYEGSTARISYEMARRNTNFPAGIKKIEFVSTDIEETAFHFADLSGAEFSPSDVQELRELWRKELGLNPNDIGFISFRPEPKNKITTTSAIAEPSYAMFDLSKKSGRSPRLVYVHYR